MLASIKKFITSYNASSRKTEEKMLDLTMSQIPDVVRNIETLLDPEYNLNTKAVEKVLKGLGIKGNSKDQLINIKGFLNDLKGLNSELMKALQELQSYSTDKTISYKDAALLEFIGDISAMVNYINDVTLHIAYGLNNEIYTVGIKIFNNRKKDFAILFASYNGNLKVILKSINNGSDEIANDVSKESLTSKDHKIQLPSTGFVSVPAYYIRKLYIDIEIWRIERAKDQKTLFEFKVMELEAKKSGGDKDKDIQKNIEYYENQIHELNLKIERLSEV